jgi:hypothetical protein
MDCGDMWQTPLPCSAQTMALKGRPLIQSSSLIRCELVQVYHRFFLLLGAGKALRMVDTPTLKLLLVVSSFV